MKNLKKIGLRLIAVLILLFIFNIIYSEFFLNEDIDTHANVIQILPESFDSTQILYFAESSNFTTHKYDLDKRKISEFIAAYYPNLKLETVNQGALHAGIYKVLLQNIPDQNNLETIIITLNLRSFGADWIYSKLETSLQKSVVLLKPRLPIINRLILSFKGYEIKNNQERLDQVIKHWKQDKLDFAYNFKYNNAFDWERDLNKKGFFDSNGQKDYDKTALACHYIKSYAFTINEDNPRVKDFDNIVKYCQSQGWNVVLNLLAENTEKAQELVGDDLIYLMDRNRNFLINRYSNMDAMVVDNLDIVSSKYYIDQNWTTEHYTEDGRKIIAATVADSLKKIYPNYYKPAIFKELQKSALYTNDCESDLEWANFNTISADISFSGKYSCKIETNQPYSLTLEKMLKQIPDSCQNSVHMEFYVWQSTLDSSLKAVVELQGDFVKTKWITQTFSNRTIMKWEKHSLDFPLNNLSEGGYNFIKIYCSNKSLNPVYVDDWLIQFD